MMRPPAPLNTPLNAVAAELVMVNDPEFNVPVPLKVKLLEPLIVVVATIVKLFAITALTEAFTLPELKDSAPVPKALVATPICSVPCVNDVVPLKLLLLVPENTNVPVTVFSVIAAAPLKLPLNVVIAVLLSVKEPLVSVPVPLSV